MTRDWFITKGVPKFKQEVILIGNAALLIKNCNFVITKWINISMKYMV